MAEEQQIIEVQYGDGTILRCSDLRGYKLRTSAERAMLEADKKDVLVYRCGVCDDYHGVGHRERPAGH